MKTALALAFAVLIVAVAISGCVQQGTTGGEGATAAKGTPEQQAFQAVDQEVDQALENMTAQEIENELLNQG